MARIYKLLTVKPPVVEGPSAESRATFADLEKRWARLERCLGMGGYDSSIFIPGVERPATVCDGDLASIPDANRPRVKNNIKQHYMAWLAFSNAWRSGNEDVTALSAQVSGLTMAEREANAGGATIKDAPKSSPDIAEASSGLKAAAVTDEAVKAASVITHDWWQDVPIGYKIGAGAAIGGVTLYYASKIYRAFKGR